MTQSQSASSENNSSTKMYWLLFLISTLACFGFLVVSPEWFWVTLPFVGTFLVKAMNKI